jgi:hypothetical protein
LCFASRHADSICPRYFQVSCGFFFSIGPDSATSIGTPSCVSPLS